MMGNKVFSGNHTEILKTCCQNGLTLLRNKRLVGAVYDFHVCISSFGVHSESRMLQSVCGSNSTDCEEFRRFHKGKG